MFLVEDAEYMIMSCQSLSPSNEQIDTPGTGNTDLQSQEMCSGTVPDTTEGFYVFIFY